MQDTLLVINMFVKKIVVNVHFISVQTYTASFIHKEKSVFV